MTFLSTFKKAVATAGDILTTKGDILSRSSSALGRLGVGSNGKVLTAKSGDALGISWETVTVADNSITLAKMASGTDGNLITYDSSGDPAYVVTGSATNVLTSNGAGQAPTFQSAGGGVQTQLSQDSARFTIAGGGTLSIQPASGEFDQVYWINEVQDITSMLTNGTNDSLFFEATGSGSKCMLSTNAIFIKWNGGGADRTAQRAIITMSEET